MLIYVAHGLLSLSLLGTCYAGLLAWRITRRS